MSIRPIAKAIFLCDQIELNPTTGKISVFNLWERIRLPPDAAFPYRLDRICVFTLWRGGHGRSRVQVDIVNARDGTLIRRGEGFVEFSSRNQTIYGSYRFDGCVFPESGYYCIEVYCDGQFVDDQKIEVVGP